MELYRCKSISTNWLVICRHSCEHCALDCRCPIVLATRQIGHSRSLIHLANRRHITAPLLSESILRKFPVSVRIGNIVCPKRNHRSCRWHRPIRYQPNRPVQNVFRRWTLSGRDDGHQPKRVDRLWIYRCLWWGRHLDLNDGSKWKQKW